MIISPWIQLLRRPVSQVKHLHVEGWSLGSEDFPFDENACLPVHPVTQQQWFLAHRYHCQNGSSLIAPSKLLLSRKIYGEEPTYLISTWGNFVEGDLPTQGAWCNSFQTLRLLVCDCAKGNRTHCTLTFLTTGGPSSKDSVGTSQQNWA